MMEKWRELLKQCACVSREGIHLVHKQRTGLRSMDQFIPGNGREGRAYEQRCSKASRHRGGSLWEFPSSCLYFLSEMGSEVIGLEQRRKEVIRGCLGMQKCEWLARQH